MKFFKYISIALISAGILSSCNDYDNPVIDRGEYASPTLTNIAPGFYTENLSSQVQFDIILDSLQLEDVDSTTVEVSYKHGDIVSVAAKVADINSFPSTITLPLDEVITSIQAENDAVAAYDTTNNISVIDSLSVGDAINISVVTYKNGERRLSTAALSAGITCEYEKDSIGTVYNFSSSAWGTSGSVIVTPPTDADPYTFTINTTGFSDANGTEYPTGNEITLNIDPNTLSITGDTTVVSTDYFGYTNFTQSVKSGTYSTCDGNFEITFDIYVDQGSFGSFEFEFEQ